MLIVYHSTSDQILSGLTRTITGAREQTTKMDPSKNIVDFHLVPFYNLGQTYLTDDFLYKSWNNFTLLPSSVFLFLGSR